MLNLIDIFKIFIFVVKRDIEVKLVQKGSTEAVTGRYKWIICLTKRLGGRELDL